MNDIKIFVLALLALAVFLASKQISKIEERDKCNTKSYTKPLGK